MIDDKQNKTRRARNSTVSLNLDLDGDDAPVEMFSRDDGLYIISRKKILCCRSPNNIDPELKHESAPWVQSLILPHGATDPIVARTIIQSAKFLDVFFSKNSPTYKTLSDIGWEVMRSLISLRVIHNRLENDVSRLSNIIECDLDLFTKGTPPKPLPIVNYLDIEFRSFVNEVRRALSIISDLFEPLTGENKFHQGHFHEAQIWAEKTRGPDSLLAKMLQGDQRWVKAWIDIRIAIEHPKKNKFVETRNFSLEPDLTITLPTWRFIHPDYDMSRPQNLLEAMAICIENLLKFYEDLLIVLLDGHLPSRIKISIETVPEENRDKNLPVRYQFKSWVETQKKLCPSMT